jgi:P4 family phage/plasmid primase-like protien
MSNALIANKEEFINICMDFFNTIFDNVLKNELGEIEIRTFKPPSQHFTSSAKEAAKISFDLCNQGIDVYFGVNSRTGRGGKKENVKWLNTFHAEVDYGTTGHRKSPNHQTYEEVLKVIHAFKPEPTLIVHSGGGFHCYWVLQNPLNVIEYGVATLESINKSLSTKLGGDSGTQNIDRVLRVPGTFNFKIPDNPRLVEVVAHSGKKYVYEDFKGFTSQEKVIKEKSNQKPSTGLSNSKAHNENLDHVDVDSLFVSERIKSLIRNGNDGTYESRSEVDMAVITALVNKGVSEEKIQAIFSDKAYQIGEKYRTHNAPDTYLKHNIEKAKEKSNLTEEEIIDPLFLTGAIHKDDKRGYRLKVVKLQEYIVRKHRLRILDQERAFFRYNGKCYEQLTSESLNMLCQRELKNRRELFKKSALDELIHYAVGDILIDSEKARNDQVNYLTLQNGLFKLDEGILVPHIPEIFTTNLLPYNYDPLAMCDRFIRYLDEVFFGDQEKINFIQEAAGYCFHKSLPTPAVFFLVGGGSNGKSVLINTLSNLVGKENTSNISFNSLSDEHYIVQLFQKMINVSGETPYSKQINTDTIKAVTAGDWVTGRDLYKHPMKFRPFAKHYLAMNKLPNVTDTSHGMWRRIWLIEFPRTFSEEEMDRDLESKLIGELSGIFNWALEGYRRLRERKFRLTEPQSMKLTKQDYRREMDSVRAFANECLEKTNDSNNKVKFGSAYQAYLTFCQNDGKKEFEKKSDFRKVLKDLGYKIDNSKVDGNQLYIFNARLVGEAE